MLQVDFHPLEPALTHEGFRNNDQDRVMLPTTPEGIVEAEVTNQNTYAELGTPDALSATVPT